MQELSMVQSLFDADYHDCTLSAEIDAGPGITVATTNAMIKRRFMVGVHINAGSYATYVSVYKSGINVEYNTTYIGDIRAG